VSEKQKFAAEVAYAVARGLMAELEPVCERIVIAGSLRREKKVVGDLELLYIPKFEPRPDPFEFFLTRQTNLADEVIARWEGCEVLNRRKNKNGAETFGPKNKLMRHATTGLPVDLFEATPANWWNLLVCRTGPLESNIRLAQAAQARGWKWNSTGEGFSRPGERRATSSERDVFEFAGLEYLEPPQRI